MNTYSKDFLYCSFKFVCSLLPDVISLFICTFFEVTICLLCCIFMVLLLGKGNNLGENLVFLFIM